MLPIRLRTIDNNIITKSCTMKWQLKSIIMTYRNHGLASTTGREFNAGAKLAPFDSNIAMARGFAGVTFSSKSHPPIWCQQLLTHQARFLHAQHKYYYAASNIGSVRAISSSSTINTNKIQSQQGANNSSSNSNNTKTKMSRSAYVDVLHLAVKPKSQTIMSHLQPPRSAAAKPALAVHNPARRPSYQPPVPPSLSQLQASAATAAAAAAPTPSQKHLQLPGMEQQLLENNDTMQQEPVAGKTIPIVKGSLSEFNTDIQDYILGVAELCQPREIYICDGTRDEYDTLCQQMVDGGSLIRLKAYPNSYLARTDPADVARVERKTFITTYKKRQTVPNQKPGVQNQLNQWLSPRDAEIALNDRFPGCMAGRTMYVIPYAMGPIGGPITKYAIELTDSAYVVVNMHIMTRVDNRVKEMLRNVAPNDFVKCLHSVGQPLPMPKPAVNNWPCNPEMTLILHVPERNEIASFGSGYGGNSLLGKKCFALRLGSILAQREGWLAEHMLIMKFTNPKGDFKYIAAAFPSACGKTNLAMMQPTLPGYKCECVGDDIAWMKFDENGVLRAINPERGFFGVAPGTSSKTNPVALDMVKRDTIFANVAYLPDEGAVWWEGLERDVPLKSSNADGKMTSKNVIDWLGRAWPPAQLPAQQTTTPPAAHPNSRFCTPVERCKILDASWDDPRGVPISAILFGGRRPKGVPLVFEPYSWKHGVLVAALIKSEATAAAEHKGTAVMHDPFSMRPFLGYNFGHYMQHWLSFADNPKLQLPRIFHVNWFRRDAQNKFLWPGFGDNCRVLDWICRRIDEQNNSSSTGSKIAVESPIGYIPSVDAIRTDGLDEAVNFQELLSVPRDFWLDEVAENTTYLEEQVGEDIPEDIRRELKQLKQRVEAMPVPHN